MEEQTPQMEINDNTGTDPAFHALSNYLGVDKYKRADHEMAKKMAHIYNWSQVKGGSDDPLKILQDLHGSVRGLGVQFKGEELVNYLFQHSRLDSSVKQKSKPRKATSNNVDVQIKQAKEKVQKRIEKQVGMQVKKAKEDARRKIKREMDLAVKEGIKSALKNTRSLYG